MHGRTADVPENAPEGIGKAGDAAEAAHDDKKNVKAPRQPGEISGLR